jgi:rhomboid protease GluP
MIAKGPLLCPACRKLISADEPKCPYCGLTAPGSRLKQALFSRLLSDGGRFINALIAVNVIMYGLCLVISRRGLHVSGNPMTFLAPDSQALLLLGATGSIPIDQLHRWWTLLSASYLHGSMLHIAFNMIALRQISPLIVGEYGTARMFVIYSLSGVGGFLLSYLAGVQLTIGASAAVCGLIGAALYYGKSRGGRYGQAIFRQVGSWVLGIFLFGILVPGINNWAHGGGMATGALLGMLMGYRERIRENRFHRFISGLCLVLTMGVLLWAMFTAVSFG